MCPHVRGNRRALRKLTTTYLARERFLARMRTQMCCQIGRLRKRLIASVTFIRFFTLYNKKKNNQNYKLIN